MVTVTGRYVKVTLKMQLNEKLNKFTGFHEKLTGP